MRSSRGGSGQQKKTAIEQRFKSAGKEVHCQRFYTQGPYSQYFEVRQPDEAENEQARPHTGKKAIERLWQRAVEYTEQREKEKQDIIKQGDVIETTP